MGLTDGNAESYGFGRDFERAMIALCCQRPQFWGRIGKSLDVELIRDSACRKALETLRAISTDLGRGPSDPLMIIQRMRRMRDEGKVTLEDIRAVTEILEDADDRGLPSEEEMVSEIAPILKRRAQQAAVRQAITAHGKDSDLTDVAEKILDAQRIGQVDTSQGTRIGMDSFEAIRTLRRMQRLPTGIDDLDLQLSGGLARKALGVIVGGAGDGKSMMLSHIAAQCMYDGLAVVYATLEIPEGEVLARIKANLTDMAIDAITSGDGEGECMRRLQELGNRKFDFRPGLGLGITKEFSPFTTTVHDIKQWLDLCEQQEKRPIDVMIVDYADRMGAPKQDGDYNAQKVIYEGLRNVIDERGIFGWTACQATRSSDRKRWHDLNDMADSMHKGRIADLVITLNLQGEEGDEMEYYVAKHRTGKSRFTVGPMRHDFAHGMMAAVSRDVTRQ